MLAKNNNLTFLNCPESVMIKNEKYNLGFKTTYN